MLSWLRSLTPDTAPPWLPRPVKGRLVLLAARARLHEARHLPADERLAAAFAVTSLDLVHYETLSPFADDQALLEAVLHEETPFRAHARWCRRSLERGDCDCGACWQAFIDGELKSMPASV